MKKHYGNRQPPTDIVFYAFNGEESGMQGSKAAISELTGKYTDFYNINFDMAGSKNNPTKYTLNTNEASKSLADAFASHLTSGGFEISFSDEGASDHIIFQNKGIAAIDLSCEALIPITHTVQDTADALNLEAIETLSRVTAEFIDMLDGKIFEAAVQDKASPEYRKKLQELTEKTRQALDYDEACIFDMDGERSIVWGSRPLSSMEEIEKYYPSLKFPENLGKYSRFVLY